MSSKLELHVVPKPSPAHPSTSYYCQKLDTYLRAASHSSYTPVPDMPFKGPKGKVPWVVFEGGERMGDSYFIIRRLIKEGTIKDLDEHLSAQEKADARAWVVWVDELIYPATLCQRFLDDKNWAKLYGQIAGDMPWGLRWAITGYVRRQARLGLWGHGVARHTDQERLMILEEFLEAVERKLENGKWLFGEQVTGADVVLYGWCANCLETEGNPWVRERLLGSERLKRFVREGTGMWFPEYEAVLGMVEEGK